MGGKHTISLVRLRTGVRPDSSGALPDRTSSEGAGVCPAVGSRAPAQGACAPPNSIVKLTDPKLRQLQDMCTETAPEYSIWWLGPSATS